MMAHAKQSADWERTAWLLAKIHNCHCTTSVTPEQCNPFTAKPLPEDLTPLKHILKPEA